MSVREFRVQLGAAIRAAEEGEEVIITRRGAAVARLVAAGRRGPRVPDWSELRASVQVSGESALETLLRMRREDRFDVDGR